MARLRAPDGCPWDREQNHQSIRFHAVEEVYELIDAIEAGDDIEMREELGDLLLQVVFHAQLARERGAFDFEDVVRGITEKLIRRHPHVFGDSQAESVDEVWSQWERIKKEEKDGTHLERESVLDGVPRHLPALQRAEKLIKKARKHGLLAKADALPSVTREALSKKLWETVLESQAAGWRPEELLREEAARHEADWRRLESASSCDPLKPEA